MSIFNRQGGNGGNFGLHRWESELRTGVDSITVNDGTATVHGSHSSSGGRWLGTTEATINGGTFNHDPTIIGGAHGIYNATQSGGTVNNGGRIQNFTYFGGTYNGTYEVSPTWIRYGTINNLILATDASNNPGDWGNVNNIRFHENGNGMLTIAAIGNDIAPFGIQATSASSTSGIGLSSNINAQNIDFAFGRLVLDLTGIGNEIDIWASFQNEFASLFGNVSGLENLYTFEILSTGYVQEGDLLQGLAMLALIGGYLFDDSEWDFVSTSAGGLVAVNTRIEAMIPEPATLAIVALGLAGLGYARRRRK